MARSYLVCLAILIALVSGRAAHADLRAYWSFDNGSGTALTDSSGNAVNGTLEGALLPAWTAGMTGKPGDFALNFTAAGQGGGAGLPVTTGTDTSPVVGASRVDLGLASPIRLAGTETISMWIQPNASTVRQNLMGISYSGLGSIVLENVNAGTQVLNGFNFYWGNGGNNSSAHNNGADSLAITRDGSTWTNVVFQRQDNGGSPTNWSWNIYYNGVLANTTTSAPTTANINVNDVGTPNVYLGAGYVTSFDGKIDDSAIWNEYLSSGKISAIYNTHGVATNALYQKDFSVADLDRLFKVFDSAGSITDSVKGYNFSYVSNLSSLFPSLAVGQSMEINGQLALLLNSSGAGVLGLIPLAPEPGSMVLFALTVSAMAGSVWWRRRANRGAFIR